MRKILSVLLSVVMILSIIPIGVLPATAETANETEQFFTILVENNSFQIIRRNTWSQQTVTYRTVSVTAVEGIHFTPAVGTVTFEYGEWYKTITVTETAVENIPIRYRYQSDKYREYRFEVLDSNGFLVASARRQIDYGDDYKFNNEKVNSSVPELLHGASGCQTQYYGDVYHTASIDRSFQIKDLGYEQGVYSVPTANIFTLPGLAPKEYLSAIGDKLYAAVRIYAREDNDGYQYIQILADNSSTFDGNDPYGEVNTPSVSLYKACFERDVGSNANSQGSYMTFPHKYNYKNKAEENAAGVTRSEFRSNENQLWAQQYRNSSVKAPNAGAVLLDPMTQELDIRFDAGGNGSDTWYFSEMMVRYAIGDEFPPVPADNIYVSGGSSYKKRSPVTITVCFNEIVVPGSNCVLKTTWGDFPVIVTNGYANVLSFSGAITANPGTQLKITGIQGTVSDLFGRNMTVGLSKTFSYTVAQNPTVPSSNGVYLISNAGELYAYADMLESYPNRSARLTDDIDMINSDIAGFKAMGGANGFSGTFDGDGHKIINLNNVSAAANGLCGLFGCIAAGGSVRDLDIEIMFTAPLGSSGAICGINRGTVDKCIVSGVITNSAADSAQSSASNCFGGVVGDNRGSVLHCYAINWISNRWQNLKAGGIVGYNSGTVESCCYNGKFTANYDFTRGAICGDNAGGTVRNCAARRIESDYPSVVGTSTGTVTNTSILSLDRFQTGYACYEVLNNGVSDGTQFWYQNLDNGQSSDEFPLFSGGTVYKHGNIYTNSTVHTLSHVDAVAADCETAGRAEYWICTFDGCGKIFSDANAQNETTLEALTVPALGHDLSTDWSTDNLTHCHYCTRCGKGVDIQPHADSTPVWDWNGMFMAEADFNCSVCGADYIRYAAITTVQSGDTVTYTASVTVNGNTYTDERTGSLITVGENSVYIQLATDQIYSFIPPQDGDYRFYSVGEYDPQITVFNENGNYMAKNDICGIQGSGKNFSITVSLEAGKIYTVKIHSSYVEGHHTGLMTMFIENAALEHDVNSDGYEDNDDIGFLVSASAGNTAMNWAQKIKADLNSDGVVDGFDAAEVDRYLYSINTAKGDVNQDGDIGLADYVMTRAHISGVSSDGIQPANLLDKSYLTSEYDGIKDNYSNGTIITQQYYCADYNSDKAVDAFDLFRLDKRLNNIA